MKEKQHIDELFKGQLQDFEATPSPEVWNNIQAKMKKEKEDRKIIPIWWKLGGVAATLALLLTIGTFVWNPFNNGTGETTIVKEESEKDVEKDKTSIVPETNETIEAYTSEENIENKAEESSEVEKERDAILKEQITNDSQQDREAIAVEKDPKKDLQQRDDDKVQSKNFKDPMNSEVVVKDAVATTSEKNGNTKTINEKPDTKTNKAIERNPLIKKDASEGVINKGVTGVAETTDSNKTNPSNVETGNEKVADKNNVFIKKAPSEIIQEGKSDEGITGVDTQEEEKDEEKILDENKKSIFDAIEEEKEEAVAKTEDKDIRSWEVTPNVGPVFYSSLGEGSSIDPSFADNSQSGDVNFSYGVQVSYNINDRLSLRSGVSNVNLGYSTGGIELASAPSDVALSSIDYGDRTQVLTAFDRGTVASLPAQGEDSPFSNLNLKSTGGDAELVQNLSYYEVPMELKYALVNNRFGVNMIGGFSTLFLGNNEVSVRDGDFRDVLGEANNLNSVSFSTNIGLGFDYKISKRLKFNIEPMFKYQLNPYTDSSVDFRPYYFGVYSGLSFKF